MAVRPLSDLLYREWKSIMDYGTKSVYWIQSNKNVTATGYASSFHISDSWKIQPGDNTTA